MTDTINSVRPLDVCDRYIRSGVDNRFITVQFTTVTSLATIGDARLFNNIELDVDEFVKFMTEPYISHIKSMTVLYSRSCNYIISQLRSGLVLSYHYRKLFSITI